ncbi:SDR family NAD(P)-dependent oxidoreductase, partial [Paenibacillus polymyxa]|nr:SDR family NAD(P)-dependent oxidoreductase [Paenibacillus polymyxa]
MISFERQVAAITGAGNGIGLATARLMAAHSARLVLPDIDHARLQEVAAELDPSGQRVYTHALDVSVSHDCERVFEAAARHFG